MRLQAIFTDAENGRLVLMKLRLQISKTTGLFRAARRIIFWVKMIYNALYRCRAYAFFHLPAKVKAGAGLPSKSIIVLSPVVAVKTPVLIIFDLCTH